MFSQRLAATRNKIVRVKVLANAIGKIFVGLFVSGISPSALHSAQIFCVSNLDLSRASSVAGDTVGLTAGESSHALMLTMGLGYDPLFAATTSPVMTYIEFLWQNRGRIGHIANAVF